MILDFCLDYTYTSLNTIWFLHSELQFTIIWKKRQLFANLEWRDKLFYSSYLDRDAGYIFNFDLVNFADWKNKSAEGSQATGTAATPRPGCLWQVCQHHWTQVSLAGQVPGEWTLSGEAKTPGEPLVQPHWPTTPTQSWEAW